MSSGIKENHTIYKSKSNLSINHDIFPMGRSRIKV